MSKAGANTHANRALLKLRERILTGEFGVGMRLYEVPVAEQLEISITPVRDAFGRLAERGYWIACQVVAMRSGPLVLKM